jgi:predicted NAD/FAD-binding protein
VPSSLRPHLPHSFPLPSPFQVAMKIAVVGSGCTGLGATWVRTVTLDRRKLYRTIRYFQLLNEHSKHEVHLYESDSRPGGHANTFTFSAPGKEPVDVDGLVASTLCC